MKKSIVFMFSGQGSQYYQMGKELYENYPRFRLWMDHCDRIARPLTQTSLIEIIYHGGKKNTVFDRLLYTNPALLAIEYSLARLLMEMRIQPDYVLGYSLGEITAAVVAGSVSLEEGMQLVVAAAKLLEQEGAEGGMLAILDSADIMQQFPELFTHCWLSAKNFQRNFVVSGLAADIVQLQKALSQKHIAAQRLPVNYGFHTELLDPIQGKFKTIAQQVKYYPIKIPIISTLRARQIQEVNADHFWDLIRYPVEFEKTVRSMLQNEDFTFIDVGPSGSLSTFVKYLLPYYSNSQHLEVINPFGKNLNSIQRLRENLNLSLCEVIA